MEKAELLWASWRTRLLRDIEAIFWSRRNKQVGAGTPSILRKGVEYSDDGLEKDIPSDHEAWYQEYNQNIDQPTYQTGADSTPGREV